MNSNLSKPESAKVTNTMTYPLSMQIIKTYLIIIAGRINYIIFSPIPTASHYYCLCSVTRTCYNLFLNQNVPYLYKNTVSFDKKTTCNINDLDSIQVFLLHKRVGCAIRILFLNAFTGRLQWSCVKCAGVS